MDNNSFFVIGAIAIGAAIVIGFLYVQTKNK